MYVYIDQRVSVEKLHKDTAKHNPVCACSEFEWLRRQKILTFQPWIILPKLLIYLLSSALLFRRRDWCPKLCKASTSHKGLAIFTNQYPEHTTVFFGRQSGDSVIFCCVIFSLLQRQNKADIHHLKALLQPPLKQINFLSLFRSADGNQGYFKQLPKHHILEGHSADCDNVLGLSGSFKGKLRTDCAGSADKKVVEETCFIVLKGLNFICYTVVSTASFLSRSKVYKLQHNVMFY